MKDKIFIFSENFTYNDVEKIFLGFKINFSTGFSLIEVDLVNKIVKNPSNYLEDFRNYYNKNIYHISDLIELNLYYKIQNTPIIERKLFNIKDDKDKIKEFLDKIYLFSARKKLKEINIEYV